MSEHIERHSSGADDTDWKVDGENLKTAKVYLGFASETGEMDIIEQDPMPHRAPDGKIVPDVSLCLNKNETILPFKV